MRDKRRIRKKQHLKYSMLLENKLRRNIFNDITILHNCLSEVTIKDIDLSTELSGLKLKNPIIINAITGGIPEAKIINKYLSKIAKITGIAMAVGSQKIALDNPNTAASFKIVRKVNPHGIIFANMGADATIEEAKKAVDMIEADALQLHLNAPQEIIMREGRKDFAGTLANISKIIEKVDVPVIVKEVGFGIAKEEALALVENNVKIIDVSGTGGTNFIAIENMRNKEAAFEKFTNWGIPTPISLIETLKAVGDRADVISSGGLNDGLDAAKSIALGAKAVAFAGSFLYILMNKGHYYLEKHIFKIIKEMKYIMAMVGAKNLLELRKRPVIIQGKSLNWLKTRGIQL